jgi:hypothetical protein
MSIVKSNNISVTKVAQENYKRRMAIRENITRMVNSFIKNLKPTPKKVKKLTPKKVKKTKTKK